jgi:pre-rRNA-processing protein IPI1
MFSYHTDAPIQSKLVVLHSLSTFLQAALSSSAHFPSSLALNTPWTHSWYFAPSFAKPEAFVSFEELLQPAQQRSDSDHRTWQAEVDPRNDHFTHHYSFSICHQPYLDSVLDDAGSMENSSGISYTFITVWFFVVLLGSISNLFDISI